MDCASWPLSTFVHSFFYLLYLLVPGLGSQRSVRGRVRPWIRRQLIETNYHLHSHSHLHPISESPINLTHIFVDYWVIYYRVAIVSWQYYWSESSLICKGRPLRPQNVLNWSVFYLFHLFHPIRPLISAFLGTASEQHSLLDHCFLCLHSGLSCTPCLDSCFTWLDFAWITLCSD